jgi:hypothetical protein
VETGKQTGRGNKKVLPNSGKPLRTDKAIAKAAGVGHDTVARVEKIIAKAAAPVLEKLRTGMPRKRPPAKSAGKKTAPSSRRQLGRGHTRASLPSYYPLLGAVSHGQTLDRYQSN